MSLTHNLVCGDSSGMASNIMSELYIILYYNLRAASCRDLLVGPGTPDQLVFDHLVLAGLIFLFPAARSYMYIAISMARFFLV